ncbi:MULTISPECIES: hypothetical protein [unclassified Leucobacter]|uniref:hypothetical protein n=1 Tax=unclassified Leucobacter TaxID=2621730 RepID=UPI000621C1ED|nr:hypothetical protein [Leucobacter sp. Ag1]KKI22639.1 hypothetical protein XM48_00755 [Leucobacter sp. Ag1]
MNAQDPSAPIDPADADVNVDTGDGAARSADPAVPTVDDSAAAPTVPQPEAEPAAEPAAPGAEPQDSTIPPQTAEQAAPHAPQAERTQQTRPFPQAQSVEPRRRVRTGPIVWGSLILAFCAFVVQMSLAPGTVDPAVWISGTVLGLGVLLLGVSAGILARNARARRRD